MLIEEVSANSGKGVNVFKMPCDWRMPGSKPTVGNAPLLIQPEGEGAPVINDNVFDVWCDASKEDTNGCGEFVL